MDVSLSEGESYVKITEQIAGMRYQPHISTKQYLTGLIIILLGYSAFDLTKNGLVHLNLKYIDPMKLFFETINDSTKIDQCSLKAIHVCQQISSRTLLFRLEGSAGFTSEMNNLIRAFYYAIRTKQSFRIDDRFWNYGSFSSWFDDSQSHFLSQFTSSNNHYHRWMWRRFMKELNNNRQTSNHSIIGRNVDGGFGTLNNMMETFENHSQILYHKRLLARYLWTRLNNEMKSFIKNCSNKIQVEHIDYGMHIRRGDKLKEASSISSQRYIDAVEYLMRLEGKSNFTPRIFIASDQFGVIEELRRIRPQWNFLQLPMLNNRQRMATTGHVQDNFNQLSLPERLDLTRILIAEIDILSQIKYIVCTFSSNMCRFIQILRLQTPQTIISLDEQWHPK